MATAKRSTTKMMVEKDVDVYKLELTPDEFVTLRTFLGSTSFTDIIGVKGLYDVDEGRIEAIYTAMTTFLEGR